MTAEQKSRPGTMAAEHRSLDRLIFRSELIDIVGVSYVTVWSWMRAGTFPRGRDTSAGAPPGLNPESRPGSLRGLFAALRAMNAVTGLKAMGVAADASAPGPKRSISLVAPRSQSDRDKAARSSGNQAKRDGDILLKNRIFF